MAAEYNDLAGYYKDLICDHCGRTIRLNGKPISIGNSRLVAYELPPFDWTMVNEKYDLCPICSRKYEEITDKFCSRKLRRSSYENR